MAGTSCQEDLLRAGHSENVPIFILDDYDQDEAQVLNEIKRIDLTQDDDTNDAFQGLSRNGGNRTRTAQGGAQESVKSYAIHGIRVKIDDFVELSAPVGEWQYQFVQISRIWVSKVTSEVLFRGLPFTRAHNLQGRVECKRNEVCQILEFQADDGRHDEEQALVEMGPEQIKRKRSLIKTNATFPTFTVDKDPSWLMKTQTERFEQGPLVCRWKMCIAYRNARFRENGKSYDASLVHLTEDDISDQTNRASDQDRRKAWRGVTKIPGRGDRYTFGDIFCGGGGASRGAQQGGFKIEFGVDVWAPACRSYERNFPAAAIFQKDVTAFIQDGSHPHVDVLHISPPCQPWSPANTHPNGGKNGEKNQAALFSVSCLLGKVRPRLVTIEQTFGILHDRHAVFFNGLVKQFTCKGYSIHWKEVPLVTYGLPQTRRRLIMIASAPGEKLPPFPVPTHGPGLKPFGSERRAIDRISRNTTLHNIRGARQVDAVPRSGNEPLRCTITTAGAQRTYHYSGRRGFTLREIACLQGFPEYHIFEGECQGDFTTQIGNAFPPPVVRVLYNHLRKWLELQDGDGALAVPHPSPIRHILKAPDLRTPHGMVQPAAPVPFTARPNLYNGGLDEDEATAQATRESLLMKSRPSVFPMEESENLPARMNRLSVTPLPKPDQFVSPAGGSAPAQSSTPGCDFDYIRESLLSSRLHSSSAASSVILARSPEPSPSLRGKRKHDALRVNGGHDRQADRPGKRERADEDDEVKFLYEMRADPSGLAERIHREASVSSFVSRPRSEASVPPLEGSNRPLSFGNRLGKLPVTKATHRDWEI